MSWRDAAAAELGRVSGRRAHGDELTPAEQRVAELAAEGRQNKEIAAELFLSVATVEAHLSRVYRKLGLRSRTELARSARAADERAAVEVASARRARATIATAQPRAGPAGIRPGTGAGR